MPTTPPKLPPGPPRRAVEPQAAPAGAPQPPAIVPAAVAAAQEEALRRSHKKPNVDARLAADTSFSAFWTHLRQLAAGTRVVMDTKPSELLTDEFVDVLHTVDPAGAARMRDVLDGVDAIDRLGAAVFHAGRMLTGQAKTAADTVSLRQWLSRVLEVTEDALSWVDEPGLPRLSAAQRATPIHHATPPPHLKTAAIIGAGPAGLSQAIELAMQGVKVTLIEKRSTDYTRPTHMILRQETLDALERFGALDDVMAQSGYVDYFEAVDDIAGTRTRAAPKRRAADPERELKSAAAMVAGDSPVLAVVADIETALAKRARALGVEFIEHSVATISDENERGQREVSVRTVAKNDAGAYVATGPARVLEVDLVLAADGANSETRKAMGIEMIPDGPSAHYIAALVDHDMGPIVRKRKGLTDEGYITRQIAKGHSKNGKSWVIVEVTPEYLKHVSSSPEAALAYFRSQAAKILELSPEEMAARGIDWGGDKPFAVQNRRASRSTLGTSYANTGDADRTAHMMGGAGANLAITADSRNIHDLCRGLRDGESKATAIARYGMACKKTGSAWLDSSLKSYVQRPEATHRVTSP